MKQIKLTQGKVAIVDERDFNLLNNRKWCFSDGYAMRNEKGRMLQMHREILKTPKGFDTDHIDGDRLNNQRSNLRVATRKENSRNRVKVQGTSKYKGVSLFKRTGKWTAQICPDGRKIHLGYFLTEEKAAQAYDRKALELWGEFAKLN